MILIVNFNVMGKNFYSDPDFQSLIQILIIESVYGIIETVTMIVFYTKVIINSPNFRTTIFNSNVYSIAPNFHEFFQCITENRISPSI